MKRLKLLIVLFCLAVSLPLAYVIVQTYNGLDQEERAQMRFFSEALFDEIEQELAQLVQREENRAVDEYHFSHVQAPLLNPSSTENYILGYLQNNPDGSFQTPLVANLDSVPAKNRDTIVTIKSDNAVFNSKKFAIAKQTPVPEAPAKQSPRLDVKKKATTGFADRYLSKSAPKAAKTYLGQKTVRREAISAQQALNLAREGDGARALRQEQAAAPSTASGAAEAELQTIEKESRETADEDAASIVTPLATNAGAAFQIEVAPMQSVYIQNGRFYIFRRIVINNQIYRQGFLLRAEPFLRHLAATHFDTQPMSRFSSLSLHVMENGIQKKIR